MKPQTHRSEAVRKAARGQSCTLRLPGVCRNRVDTVVWCHSPYPEDGKAAGHKGHDMLGCMGCFECHDVLDGRSQCNWISKEDLRDRFHQAMKRSWIRFWQMGVKLW